MQKIRNRHSLKRPVRYWRLIRVDSQKADARFSEPSRGKIQEKFVAFFSDSVRIALRER